MGEGILMHYFGAICFDFFTSSHADDYAPNFEKVDGAYCFWSVRAWVRGWVTLFVPTVTFKPLKLEP